MLIFGDNVVCRDRAYPQGFGISSGLCLGVLQVLMLEFLGVNGLDLSFG